MKVFIISLALIVLCTVFAVFQQDSNFHEMHLFKTKFVSEEAAAAAAQYYEPVQYSEGIFKFNRVEGIKAAKYIIKNNLKLDDTFTPIQPNYWTEEINYSIEFFDDSNTMYPYLYNDSQGIFSTLITAPTVVVTIDAGKPRYRVSFITSVTNCRRIAAHEWKGR